MFNYNMDYNNQIILFVLLLILFTYFVINPDTCNTYSYMPESFIPAIENDRCLKINDAGKEPQYEISDSLLSAKNLDGKFNMAPQYMNNADFVKMVNNIKQIIVNTIVEYGAKCNDMNGYTFSDRLEQQQLTFTCYSDMNEIEENIILRITSYIIKTVKSLTNINLNPYYLVNIMKLHLGLKEGLVYPLGYSELYTKHGVQYFTKNMIISKVNTNLDINNTLFTIISNRGIVLLNK